MSRTPTPLFREFASLIQARSNCKAAGNTEWYDTHTDSLSQLVDFLPSGSGIDNGVKLDYDRSKPDKLVFTFGYHHMNENGYYDGWTEHTLTVTPTLMAPGFDMRITGRDRNMVKEYLYDVFTHAFTAMVWQEKDETGNWGYQTELYGKKPPMEVS